LSHDGRCGQQGDGEKSERFHGMKGGSAPCSCKENSSA
jgi:hypothetical protein